MDKVPPIVWWSTRKYDIRIAQKTGKLDQPIRKAGRLAGKKRQDYMLAVCYQDNIYDRFSHDQRM